MKESYMVEVVITDFGTVRLSPKVIAHLDAVAPRRHSRYGKRYRGKKYAEELRQLAKVEAAVMVCAAIEYRAGGMLETF